jgi:flagellar biosynthesis/type III secretory pathway M-ring protein FliF/YscJ
VLGGNDMEKLKSWWDGLKKNKKVFIIAVAAIVVIIVLSKIF